MDPSFVQPASHEGPCIFGHFILALHPSLLIESGHGVCVKTVVGKEYIDGLAGLWNVLVGHGNTELAEAARQQMSDLAFCSTYIGSANPGAMSAAEKMA